MMSPVNDSFQTGATASRVGADLRAAREHLGWTLPAIASHLRIRLPFLEAIEEGRIADLPGNAYAVGFLRTYAQALGLDPDEIARRFRAEAADVNRKTELAFPAPVPERGVPAGAVVLLGVVLAIGAYVGWYRMSGNDKPAADQVQRVPERLAPLAQGGGAPSGMPTAPTSAAPASIASGAGAALVASIPPSAAAAMPAPPAFVPPVFGPPAPGTLSVPATASAPAANVPMPAASAGGPFVPAADGSRILVRAKADAWVQVRERQGAVLLNRVMRSGETWPVPAKAQLLLTTGNAAGTELVVDGVTAPSLGGDGAVRRDMPLDPDAIRDGKLSAAAVPPAKPVPPKP